MSLNLFFLSAEPQINSSSSHCTGNWVFSVSACALVDYFCFNIWRIDNIYSFKHTYILHWLLYTECISFTLSEVWNEK